jgi:hypothetical protein
MHGDSLVGTWARVGGSSRRRVTERLRLSGHTVFTPSYTGIGDGRRAVFDNRRRRQPLADAGTPI